VRAAEDLPAYERAGESSDRLDRIADKLDRLLERMEGRMGPGGPPRGERRGPPAGPPHDGPPPCGRCAGAVFPKWPSSRWLSRQSWSHFKKKASLRKL
jgi:hypothetical protein